MGCLWPALPLGWACQDKASADQTAYPCGLTSRDVHPILFTDHGPLILATGSYQLALLVSTLPVLLGIGHPSASSSWISGSRRGLPDLEVLCSGLGVGCGTWRPAGPLSYLCPLAGAVYLHGMPAVLK